MASGIRVLYEPKQNSRHNTKDEGVDIVAIHGIGAHPDRTWTGRGPAGNEVCWLEDSDMLPGAVPNARIMRFGYESSWYRTNEDDPKKTIVGNVAEMLLKELELHRVNTTRPIIFVAHSYGGLVLMQALRRSFDDPKSWSNPFRYTAGLVFFGTPIRGRGGLSLKDIIDAVAQSIPRSEIYSETMALSVEENPYLQDIVSRFTETRDRDHPIPLCCFFETKPSPIGKTLQNQNVPDDYLVSEHSACFDRSKGVKRHPLERHHYNLQKFPSADDPAYRAVVSEIVGLVTGARDYLRECSNSQYHPRPTVVYYSIPFSRNENLVPRNALMSKLNQILPATFDYQAAALWGLGGSGKTQIALEYAYNRCHDRTCSVFWVHADTETSFMQDYQFIARKLGLAKGLDGEDLLQTVRERIEAVTNWVLVLDNADDLGLFGVNQPHAPSSKYKWNLNDFIPRGLTGTVLWTSRDKQIVGSLVGLQQEVHIVQMTPEEAETLLESVSTEKTKENEYDSMGQLLKELGYLPLAISQAASYMRRTSTSVRDYLLDIRDEKRRWDLLGRPYHDRHRREQASNSILRTWDISVDYLRKENELTYDILHCLAFVDNQNIPYELICEAARHLCQSRFTDEVRDNKDNVSSKNDIRAVIGRLCEFSLLSIRRDGSGSSLNAYQMHKLVQEAAQSRLQSSKDKIKSEAYFAKAAFKITDHLFPNKRWEAWERCEQYLGHALQAGTWAKIHEAEVDVALLLERTSTYLYDRGRWIEREVVDKKKLQLRHDVLGKRHPETIRSMANLAVTYHEQKRYKEAKRLNVEVLQLRRDVLGERHPETIQSMANLAVIYHSQNRYEEAEKIDVNMLQLRRDVLRERHPDTIESMANLAVAYYGQKRYKEAERLQVEALQLRRDILGERHPDTIRSMADLASTYHSQERYEEAEKIDVDMLQLRRDILGKRHLDTIRNMADLASTYYSQKRYEEAEKIEVEVLQLGRDILGERHPDTIFSMTNLAITYYSQERYEEAEKIEVEALQLGRDILEERHPYTIQSMANLVNTYRAQGKHEEAEALQLEHDMLVERYSIKT